MTIESACDYKLMENESKAKGRRDRQVPPTPKKAFHYTTNTGLTLRLNPRHI